MNKNRIGKDLLIRWAFHNPEGGVFDLTGLDLRVFLLDYFQRRVEVTDYVLESNNTLVFTFAGTAQKVTGPYTLQAWVNMGKEGQSVVDACQCFELVSCTHMEGDMGAEGPGTSYVDAVSIIQVGVQGKSAYASWISAGHKGTEADFVAWLQEPSKTASETALQTEQQVRESETLRVAAEGKREEAETARDTAESKREKAEQLRQQNEHLRSEAETARETAEGLRDEEEKKRVTAESGRATEFTRLSNEMTTATDATKEATRLAGEATSAANTAADGANKAANSANSATTEAGKATQAAKDATSAAVTATEKADAATALASTATSKADAAASGADKATAAANDAARLATTEAGKATQAAESANTAAGRVDAAITEAGKATTAANTATGNADAATGNANKAATAANDAASVANTAASSATTEAGKAGAAATKAEQAANAANTAAGTIDEKIGDIRNTIESMKTEGNALTSDVSAGKKLMADAITKKGVPTKPTDSYAVMAENVGKIYKGSYDELFKLEVDNNFPSCEVKRIGSVVFPDWLEAESQNMMVKDGKVNYLLDRKTSLKKKSGMLSVIDGSDGDILIKLPVFWYSRVMGSGNVERYTFSPTAQTSEGWVKSPEIWVGATEMVIEQHGGKMIAHSCFSMAKEFRGGNNQAAWDELPKSLLGMPRTSVSHDAMRTACANKGSFDTGVYHNFCKMLYDKLNLMFMCIYGTRNWQANYVGIDPTTGKDKRNTDGFKYGGLGRGVSDCGGWWNGFNSMNPFIKTEVGLEMGCRSGVVEYALNIGTPDQPNVVRLNVPVFLGIVNPFGHIFTAIDGLTKEVYNEGDLWKERWGIFDDPNTFVSAGTMGAAKVVEKDFVNSGFVKQMDENLLPLLVGAGESSYYADYLWSAKSANRYSCWISGAASNGGNCGGWYLNSNNGVGNAGSVCGGRLCFTPS